MAYELTKRGLRPSLVSAITGMKLRQSRQLYKDFHRQSSSSGQHPQNLLHFCNNDRYMCLASNILLAYVRQTKGSTHDQMDPRAVLRVTDTAWFWCHESAYYHQLAVERGALIEFVHYVARDFHINLCELVSCKDCRKVYLSHTQQRGYLLEGACCHCRVAASVGLTPSGSITKPPRGAAGQKASKIVNTQALAA